MGRMLGTSARLAWNVGRRVRSAYNDYQRSSTSSAKAKAVGSVSEQRDVSALYRRKRAPKRVRRAAKKFSGKVYYYMDKTQGMKTAVITASTQVNGAPTGLSNGQYALGITMYGYGNNTYAANIDTFNGDMSWIFARENGAYPTASSGSRKLRFRNCTMNYTVQNTYDEGVYMDIYFVIARANNGSTADPVSEWDQAVAVQSNGNLPTPITSATYYQLTPFDAGSFGRYWLVKSRKRVYMQANQIYSFQMRDAGNYVLGMEDVLNLQAKRNVTEGVILVFQNPFVDTVTTPGTPVPGGFQCQVTCTKTYHYAETSVSVDTIGT